MTSCLASCSEKLSKNLPVYHEIFIMIRDSHVTDSAGLLSLSDDVASTIHNVIKCENNCSRIIADVFCGTQYHRAMSNIDTVSNFFNGNIDICMLCLSNKKIMDSLILDNRLSQMLLKIIDKNEEDNIDINLDMLKKYREIADKTQTEVINTLKLYAPSPPKNIISIQEMRSIFDESSCT